MKLTAIRQLNGWALFGWIAGANALAVIGYMPSQPLAEAYGVSEMIQMSVRCTVPMLYLAFAASALQKLLRNDFSKWLLRNRRYLGLAYAQSMAWQLFFILWMWMQHWDYYTEEVYLLEDIIFQVGGYSFIFAMSVTSFYRVRNAMSHIQWRVLHKTGIYWLWFTVVNTYYYEITYYDDRQLIDYIYFAAGLLVYFLRVTAWYRGRSTAGVII